MKSDPGEETNLVSSEPLIKDQMKKLLFDKMSEYSLSSGLPQSEYKPSDEVLEKLKSIGY